MAKRGEFWASKTHCPQGHEYTVENTISGKNKYGGPSRKCRTCSKVFGKAASAKQWARKKAKAKRVVGVDSLAKIIITEAGQLC